MFNLLFLGSYIPEVFGTGTDEHGLQTRRRSAVPPAGPGCWIMGVNGVTCGAINIAPYALLLAKAFRGELVPQDPNDEPAGALLERITAQRAGPSEPKTCKPRQPA